MRYSNDALGKSGEVHQDVIVVGAGPAGLTAALALRSYGLSVLVLEKRTEVDPRPGSRAAYLHGESLAHLEAISPGLGTDIAAAGIMWHTKRTFWRGREVYCQSYDLSRRRSGLPPFTSVPQTTTEDIMLRACATAGVEIVWGTEVSTMSIGPSHVALLDGKGVERTSLYVVGADGARSVVRAGIGATLEGPRTENVFVVVDLKDDPDHPVSRERVFHYGAPNIDYRNVLMVPFAGGWRVDLNLKETDDPEWYCSEAGLRQWIPKVMPAAYGDRVSWVSTYRFAQQTATRLTDTHRRVLLCGEAAHLFAPFGARGMNSSIPDALAAAAAIREGMDRGPTTPEAHQAIDGFEERRLAAAHFNRDCAAEALTHMTGATRTVQVRRHLAAWAASWGRKQGKWLDSAPYGPTVASGKRPGSTY